MEEESNLSQANDKDVEESSLPGESNLDVEDLSVEQRQKITHKIVRDISSLRENIKACEEVITITPTDLNLKAKNIADVISYKDKINELTGKAVVLNYGLVVDAMKGHVGKGEEYGDLLQNAFLLAQRAFVNYDPQIGDYPTYVFTCVNKGLLSRHGSLHLMPVPELKQKWLKEYRQSLDDPRYFKTPDEVILSQIYPDLYGKYIEQKNNESGNYSVEEFLLIRPDKQKYFENRKASMQKANTSYDIQSLDTLPKNLVDLDQDTNSLEEFADKSLLRDSITETLNNMGLSERERQVIELRFGLIDNKDFTLKQIADYFKVSHGRVSQIEASALRKLIKPSKSESLKDYL